MCIFGGLSFGLPLNRNDYRPKMWVWGVSRIFLVWEVSRSGGVKVPLLRTRTLRVLLRLRSYLATSG